MPSDTPGGEPEKMSPDAHPLHTAWEGIKGRLILTAGLRTATGVFLMAAVAGGDNMGLSCGMGLVSAGAFVVSGKIQDRLPDYVARLPLIRVAREEIGERIKHAGRWATGAGALVVPAPLFIVAQLVGGDLPDGTGMMAGAALGVALGCGYMAARHYRAVRQALSRHPAPS